jgi:hypothetical protein
MVRFNEYRYANYKELSNHDWWDWVFDEIRAKDPEKTLIEMRYCDTTSSIVKKRIKAGYYQERGDRLLCLSFFHNDEDTQNLFLGGNTPEHLMEIRDEWIKILKKFPCVEIVEIPYDFTLTEGYLRGLFNRYITGY